ncbi:MAG: EAL domain-containing protein [Guyparkeria sp.]|uniref:EAL domain-containing protein n=1 Tax=Guyparkeria sp. TaxID=2035736 RepID=UPI00397B6376
MKLPRLSLRLMVPLGLAVLFLMITGVSLINGIHNRAEIFVADSSQRLLGYTTEIARTIEQGGLDNPGLLNARVSSILSDPRVDMLIAVGPDREVLVAPRQTWLGQPVDDLFTDLAPDSFLERQNERLPHLEEIEDGGIMRALQSFELPGLAERPRTESRGVVCVRMDLTDSLARIRNEAILARLPEAGVMLLIILLTAWMLDSQITRPLGHLRDAAMRLRHGDHGVRLPERGYSEIAEVAQGFNAMARAVAEASKKLLESERRLAVTLDSIGDGLIATDLEGHVTLMNPVAERLTGWSREEAIGQPIESVFVICHADGDRPVAVPIRHVLDEGTLVRLANHTVLTDRHGNRHHIADSAAPIRHKDGSLEGVVLVFRDVSREYQLREALAESEQHFRTLADNGQALIWTADVDGQRDYVNRPWLTFTGLTRDEALGESWQHAIHPDDLPDLKQELASAYERRVSFTREYRLRHHSGEYRWLLAKGTPRFNSRGEFIGFMGQCVDITSDKETAARLERLAYHDGLTDLPNRALLLDRVDQAIRQRKRHGGVGALLYVDLDEFKQVNDLYGHTGGDQVLIEVAHRLTGLVRDTDTIARMGGDEFLVLVPELADDVDNARRSALALADKLRWAIEQPLEFDAFRHLATASVGLTLFAGKVDNAEDLVREADIAMYQAKRAGRNNLVNFESGMVESVTRRYRLEQELKLALERGQFELHLQSQVDRDERVVGAEVLLRWRHPVRGLVSPGEFIPVAEESGQIIAIGEWVLTEACHLLHGLEHSTPTGHPVPNISVNVSPRQFRTPDFVERVRQTIEQTGIEPSHLMIEITENMLVSHASDAIARMRALAALGLAFSIDDFGTGYSSFAYLKRLPLSEIKLDKSFVDDVPGSPGDTAMVEAILAMAARLGIDVVAEGVETCEQFDYLKANDCTRFQGFCFARPIPARKWINERLEAMEDPPRD